MSISKYNTAFTSGSILLAETTQLVESQEGDIKAIFDENFKFNLNALYQNAESSKVRIEREVRQRIQAAESPHLWEQFLTEDDQNKKVIIFYSICKKYPIILDFMVDVVLKKWRNMDYSLKSDDFVYFLYEKGDIHIELDHLTDSTRKKLAQVTLRILRELGLTDGQNLQRLYLGESIWEHFIKMGESWFLEIMLLDDHERGKLIKVYEGSTENL